MKFIRLMIIIILVGVVPTLSAVAFRDGEKLTFNVKYGVVSAGEATLAVKSSTYQGNPVWYLSVNANTYPFFDSVFRVRDKVESWWDKETLLPYKFSKTMQEGKYRQYRIQTFDQQNRKTVLNKWNYKKETWKTENMALPTTTQDVLSAFYDVRNKTLVPGSRVTTNITTDGKTASTEIVVHRREKLDSIFGSIDCLVIQPRLKGEAVFKQSGKILIWITDDEYKIPIKMESAVSFGSFVAKLSNAENVPYIIKYPSK